MSSDQEPRAAAIKAAIDAALPSEVSVFDLDDVPGTNGNPGTTPQKYVVVEVSRRWVAARRFGGDVMVPGGAVATHYRADTITNARELRRRTAAGIENVPLATAGGDPFTCSFSQDAGIEYIKGVGYAGFDLWNF